MNFKKNDAIGIYVLALDVDDGALLGVDDSDGVLLEGRDVGQELKRVLLIIHAYCLEIIISDFSSKLREHVKQNLHS